MNPSFFPAHESPRASGRGWGWLRWSLERSFDAFDAFDDDDSDVVCDNDDNDDKI